MTAFRATYSDFKLIKTRQSVQIVFEIPLQDVDAALEVLGGMPNPANETWFGIAPLVPPAAKESAPATPQPNSPRAAGAKRDWRDIVPSQQAGIRCAEPVFAAFLREKYPDEWHEAPDAADCVRLICAVDSRSKLNDGPSRVIWKQLDDQFAGWKVLENA
jgi:hypothetical protein